jgi:hypothetical protein
VCPASAAQYSSTVVAGAVLGHRSDRDRLVRLDGDRRHLQGPRPGGHPPVAAGASTYAAAAAALTAAGFVPAQSNAVQLDRAAGQVIGTTPAPTAGPQPFGSKVTVAVSLGPQPVTIPN